MSEINNEIFLGAVQSPEEGLALLSKLTDASSPQAVFGAPIQQGDTTVITANSVTVGLGFGLGGFVLGRNEADQLNRQEVNGGVGGGGSSRARPVAVISINPQGVKVTPIIDVTKICLAFFGTFSALFVAIHKMKTMGK